MDTDFIKYMARGKGAIDYYFNKIIMDLQIEPVVHEFLYEKEMMTNPLVDKLVKEKKLTVMRYADFMDESDNQYYSDLLSDLYSYCNERSLEYGKQNFRTYQESGANLGEIHSVILAMFTGYTIFLSNDNGSKTMANTKINTAAYQLHVKNVMDVFNEIALIKDSITTKDDFLNLTKGDKTRKEAIQHIKQMWVE